MRLVCACAWVLAVGCGGNVDKFGDAGDAAIDAPSGMPAWTTCLGKTATYGSCNEYCASVGKACTPTCTTSRGYPNWAAEAWHAGESCSVPGSGQQTCDFAWDDNVGNPPRWKCCCK
jgi:hypothetical protein